MRWWHHFKSNRLAVLSLLSVAVKPSQGRVETNDTSGSIYHSTLELEKDDERLGLVDSREERWQSVVERRGRRRRPER